MKTFNRNLRPIDNFMQAFQVSNDAVFHPRKHRTAQTKTSLFQRSVMWLGLILALVVGSGGEVWGQISIATSDPIVEDFNSMGTATTDALSANWRIHQNSTPSFTSGTRTLARE